MYALKVQQFGRVIRLPTKESWIETAAEYGASLKPPASWLAAQSEKGRNVSAATAIWHKRYQPGDRLSAWMVATDEDYRRAGYLS